MEPIKKDSVITVINEKKTAIGTYAKTYMSHIAALFIVVVVVAVFFTDLSLSPTASIKKLSVTVIVLIICTNAMYSIGLRSGKDRGYIDYRYMDAMESYSQVASEVRASGRMGELDAYCKYLTRSELDDTRQEILIDANITIEDYKAKYRALGKKELKEAVTEKQYKAILKANRVRPVNLKPSSLMSAERSGQKRGFISESEHGVESKKRIIKFTRTILLSVLTASVVMEVILKPSWATVAECLLKLFSVVMSGYSGYTFGYELITKVAKARAESKTVVLANFLNWENPENKPCVSTEKA